MLRKIYELSISHCVEGPRGELIEDENKHSMDYFALPASYYEMKDLEEQMRLGEGERIHTTFICNRGYYSKYLDDVSRDIMPVIDTIDDLYIANAAAEEMRDMSDEQFNLLEGLATLVKEKPNEHIPAARLYDLTQNLDKCKLVKHASSDLSLGLELIETGSIPEFAALSEEAKKLLDYTSIGRQARVREGGKFIINGGYAAWQGEITECASKLPKRLSKPDYTALVHVSVFETNRHETIELPITQEELDELFDSLLASRWSDIKCWCDDCSAPSLCTLINEIENRNLPELNQLAKELAELDEGEILMFKAAIDAVKITNLRDAIELVDRLEEYTLNSGSQSLKDVGREALLDIVSPDDYNRLIGAVDLQRYGENVLRGKTIALTSYGSVRRKDGGMLLAPSVEHSLETPHMEMQ